MNCLCAADCFLAAWTAGLLSAFLSLETAAAALFLCILPALHRKFRLAGMVAAMAGCLLGMGAWHLHDAQVRQPLSALDGQTAVCTGTVSERSVLSGGRVCLLLRTELSGIQTSLPVYLGEDDDRYGVGDRLTLSAELSAVTEEYGTHTIQYEASNGHYLRCYDAQVLDFQPAQGFSVRRALGSYREKMEMKIRTALPEEEGGMLCAMLFGDKTALSRESRLALYRTGIGHVTAVSGLHLIFFCGLLTALLQALSFSPRQVFLLHFPMIGLFILLADSSVSVWRAAVMLLLLRAAPLFGRRSVPLRSLGIAMFLCTAFTPYVIGSASFWLSVSGAFGIGVLAPFLTAGIKHPRLREICSLCAVSAAVFPASVLLTGETSLLAPLCNLVILPLSIAALYLGFLLLLTGGLTSFLLPIVGIFCGGTLRLAQAVSALPFSHLSVTEPAVRVTVLLTALLLLAVLAWCGGGLRKGRFALAAFLCICAVSVQSQLLQIKERASLQISVLGRGKDAVLLVQTAGRSIVMDLTGGSRNARYVRACAENEGLQTVDLLLLNGMKRIADYQSELQALFVADIALKNAEFWEPEDTLCGLNPTLLGEESAALQIGALYLQWDGDHAAFSFHGKKICVLPAESAASSADCVIRCGGAPKAHDSCSLLFVPAVTGANFRLTVSADGTMQAEYL